jgi:hypothetical protein
VFIGRVPARQFETVLAGVSTLLEHANGTQADLVRSSLGDLVPEYGVARPSRPAAHLETEGDSKRIGTESGSFSRPN